MAGEQNGCSNGHITTGMWFLLATKKHTHILEHEEHLHLSNFGGIVAPVITSEHHI